MSPFHEIPEGFSPELLDLQDRAFIDTWRELQTRKSSVAHKENAQATRTAMAKLIFDLAATGVSDPVRLKRHALHAVEQSRPRTRTVLHLPN